MAHLPPKMEPVSADLPPITIQGVRRGPGQGADTIEINLPQFSFVNTTMSIELSSGGCLAKVETKETKLPNEPQIPQDRKFKSRITRIVLENVTPVMMGGLEFKPGDNGQCMVKIFFEHPQ